MAKGTTTTMASTLLHEFPKKKRIKWKGNKVTINGARKQRKQQYEKIDETERQQPMKKRTGGESAE